MRVLIFKKKNSICLGDIEKSAGENIRMVKVVSRDTPPLFVIMLKTLPDVGAINRMEHISSALEYV